MQCFCKKRRFYCCSNNLRVRKTAHVTSSEKINFFSNVTSPGLEPCSSDFTDLAELSVDCHA